MRNHELIEIMEVCRRLGLRMTSFLALTSISALNSSLDPESDADSGSTPALCDESDGSEEEVSLVVPVLLVSSPD